MEEIAPGGSVLPKGPTETQTDEPSHVDRRNLFKMLAGGAVLTGLVAACDVTSPPADIETRMLQRLTYGVSRTSREHIENIGPVQWLNEQLAMGQADSSAQALPLLSSYETIDYTVVNDPDSPDDFRTHFQQNPGGVPGLIFYGRQLSLVTLIRAVSSEAQLYERMVEFWNDHFNVSQFDVLFQWKVIYENTAIRPHALGTFRDLLEETAKSVAMLKYLNNEQNRVGSINENFARELLELHTVGLDKYGEEEIPIVAQLLTGWGIQPIETQGPGWDWKSDYFPLDQDTGWVASQAQPLVGWENPQNLSGEDAIVAFLDHLAGRDDTKTYVCTKMIARFVSEDTAAYPALLADMKAAWGADGNIEAVLRAMIKVDSGAASPLVTAAPKFQRPFDYTAACFRALGLEATPTWGHLWFPDDFISEVILGMGQTPHAWPAPDGYSDAEEEWLNPAMFDYRWRLVEKLVASTDTQVTGPYDGTVCKRRPMDAAPRVGADRWLQRHRCWLSSPTDI